MSFEERLMLAGLDPDYFQRDMLGEPPYIGFGDRDLLETPPPGVEKFPQEYVPTGRRGIDYTTEIPVSELPEGFVYPSSVPVVAANWDLSTYPETLAKYRIAAGDTLVGLSATYLGDPARFKEIWAVQPPATKATRSMDMMYAGEVLSMPNEATERFVAWVDRGGPPGTKPGELPPTKPSTSEIPGGNLGKAALAAGGVALALYVLTR